MKALVVASIVALSLAGCASTSGPNQTIGTGVGAVGGYGVARALGAGPAGSALGAVAGALIGNEVGRSIDAPRPQVIVQEPRYIVQQPRYIAPPPPRRISCYSVWDNYHGRYVERRVCNRY
jgi:hypothetical protein